MLILEKMLVLKTIPLFKFTPDEILLSVAEIAKEKHVEAGKLVFKKGDLGDEMYIIVKGRVKVHVDNTILAELKDREIFGEFGALMLETRTASITTVEETLFIKISHDVLYALMDIHEGLAKGIIHFLCDRIRTTTKLQIE